METIKSKLWEKTLNYCSKKTKRKQKESTDKINRKNKRRLEKSKKRDLFLSLYAKKRISKKINLKQNKIVFFTTIDTYICNPKYICEELLRRHKDYEIVWVTNREAVFSDFSFPRNIKLVYFDTISANKEIMSAKVIIDNGYKWQERGYFPKVDGQIVIQTWHGSLGLKRFDALADNNKKRIKAAEREGKYTDYCISNSTFETEKVYPIFWQNAKVWEVGHPRNDIFFVDDSEKEKISEKVRNRLNIPMDKKLALYAPTYRDDKSLKAYNIDYEKLCWACKKRFDGDWVVVLRLHPTMKNKMSQLTNFLQDNMWYDAANYPDMQELMVAVDVGITDYSSWICDFVLSNKPGFIYATDIEEYLDERGLYYPLEETPFPVARNNRELINNILSFDVERYKEKVGYYLDSLGCVEKGNAAKQVVDKIEELISG